MSTWQPTDKTFLVALLNLMTALAKRVTGEVPEVRLTDANGQTVWTYFDGYDDNGPSVRWIKEQAPARPQNCPPASSPPASPGAS